MKTRAVRALRDKTRAVESAAEGFQAMASAALAEKFSPDNEKWPDNTPVPDWETLQAFIAKRLELEREELLEAAQQHARELDDDPQKRTKRDEVVQAAYDRLVRVRHVLEQAVGKNETYALLGVRGRTPERPLTLLTCIRCASRRLRDAERRPEGVDLPGMSLDWDELADALRDDADRLEEALQRQRWDQRRADRALLHKDRVQASVNDTYVGLTKVLEGLYIAAGQRKLAARLRPTERSRSAAESQDREPVTSESEAARPGSVVVAVAGRRRPRRRPRTGSPARAPNPPTPIRSHPLPSPDRPPIHRPAALDTASNRSFVSSGGIISSQ